MSPFEAGQKSANVHISEYNPKWPLWFNTEVKTLHNVIPSSLLRLEHIGSTSVVGMAAKPIIDMLGGVTELDQIMLYRSRLEQIGFIYNPQFEDILPNRRYFVKKEGMVHKVHLHVVTIGSPFWKQHLCFRHYLRANPEVAKDYSELKAILVRYFANDRSGYQTAKSPFIQKVLEMAGCTQK